MKTHGIIRILILFFLMTGWVTVHGQRQMEVPGDNFSLEGALELFKKSSSPQEFEKMLNDAETRVNNLDLNGDGYIDYIKVIDMNEGNVHAFILQAVVSEVESQDIAVITLEKLANGKAVLQITGDEDIYGVETIIEPTSEVRTYGGTTRTRVAVNVWAWPSVRYIYGPRYSVWVSPWGWHYRPHWWRTWRPVAYYDYYPYWRPYRNYYSVCYTHRVVYAHHIYRPHRTTSVIVHRRHNNRIVRYRSTRLDNTGRYRNSRDRSNGRRINTSVRYDSNGRIRSGSNQRVSSRSSANVRNQQRNIEENRSSSRIQNNYSSKRRSTAGVRSGSNSSQQRSAGLGRNGSSDRLPGATNRSAVTPQRKSSTSGIDRNVSSQRSNARRYERGSSANTNVQRSTGRSSGSSTIQRSSGSSSVRRSPGSSSVQRSSGSSKGNANIRRSSGSNVQRSSGRTSGNSGSSSSSSSSRQSRGRH